MSRQKLPIRIDGPRIRAMLKERKITMLALGDLLYMSKSNAARTLYRGTCDRETVSLIATLLDVPPEELILGEL